MNDEGERDAEHIIEIAFYDRDEAEKLYDRLEHSEFVMMSGGTLSLHSYPDARDAALREKDAEIAAGANDIERLLKSVSTAEAEVDRLNAEIARLRSAPAQRVVEAARKRAELEATGVASMREAKEWDKEYYQVCSELNEALNDYYAAPADDGWRPIDDGAKDGEDWLLCGGEHASGMQMVCFWEEGRWHTADGPSYHQDFFSYYRPLPEPPVTKDYK